MFQIVSCLMSEISWKFHENPFDYCLRIVGHRRGMPRKYRKITVFTGLNGASPKCRKLFLSSSTIYPEIFMKIRSRLSSWYFGRTNQQRWNHNLRFRWRWGLHILTIITRDLGKLKTHNPIYWIQDNWENLLNLQHIRQHIHDNHIQILQQIHFQKFFMNFTVLTLQYIFQISEFQWSITQSRDCFVISIITGLIYHMSRGISAVKSISALMMIFYEYVFDIFGISFLSSNIHLNKSSVLLPT